MVVLEPLANDTVRMGTVFGALPGWWVGADEGRTLSPCVNPAEWDGLLRATGFSGCDTVAPIRNSLVLPITVFVSQAVDRRVDFLRSPLDMHMPLFEDIALTTTQNLVLLGGSNPHTLETITQLKHLLRHQWGRNIKTARSLADVVALDISSGTTVLSLVELDGPVFQQLTDASWESLKLLLHNAGTMLWVSCGRRAQNPYANMIVGLLRSAREEIHTLDIQSFNTDGDEFPEAHQLAKTLLQLKATTMWQRQGVNTDLLMTAEPEVVCEQSGALIIPRLIANREMNDRYNSSRRPIYDHASIDSQSTENIAILEFNDQPICLQKVPWPQKSKDGSVVQVTHSMRSAVWVARTGFMHLVLGIDCESGQQVVALTTQHALMTAVLNGLSIPVSIPAGNEEAFLALLSYQLLASVFLESTSEGTISIIHEADPAFATILTDEAQRHGMRVVFTTTSTTTAENGWLSIHPLAPERVLRALLPDNAAFLDLSGESTPKTLGARLRALLPSSSQYHTLGTVFKLSSDWEPHGPRLLRVQTRFEDCVFRTSARLANTTCTTFTVSLDDLEQTNHHIAHTVIDWSSSSLDLPVKVLPADSHIRFSDCKTYWLAGLSGGLGLLLCEWMVRHGAKYFVISSRKPKIQEQWLEKMRAAGAIIEVFAW